MRNLLLSIILSAFSFLCASFAHANEQRRITTEDGLPSNAVRSIAQDSDGFVWFGTDAGLCRFDGIRARLFYNPLQDSDQYVSSLYAWGRKLLVGSSLGAYVFDCETETFAWLDDEIKGLVTSFSVDADGNVWVSTMNNGLFCSLTNSEVTKHYDFSAADGVVASVFVDSSNQVWALARKGKSHAFRLNRANSTFEPVSMSDGLDADGMCIAQAQDGSLLFGTWSNGVIVLHPDGNVSQLLNPQEHGVGSHIHALLPQGESSLLVGCDEGLINVDLNKRTWSRMTPYGSAADTARRFVYSLMADSECGFWVGSFYDGVTYFSPAGQRFTPILASDGGLHGRIVSRFAEDERHRMWIASDDGGLNCYDLNSGKFVSYPGQERLANLNVHGLLADGDYVYAGTYGSGLIRLDVKTGASKTFALDGSLSASCYALLRDSKGRLWAASMTSANLFDEAEGQFHPVKDFQSMTVDIEEDREGNIWFATQGGGLWRLSLSGEWMQFVSTPGVDDFPSNQVNCVRIGSSGQIYVATQSGLCCFVAATGSFRRIDIDVENPDFSGMAIYQDDLWLTSPNGVVHYSPNSKPQVFNRHDGLQDLQFQPNACLMASNGSIWLGMTNGISTFSPFRIKPNRVEPPVFFTSVYLFDKELCSGCDKMPTPLRQDGRVTLSHDDAMITINFAALSYVSPQKNQYSYFLEGFDHMWHYVGSNTSATYTNLPPGNYRFRVSASNNDGVWSPREACLDIEVTPPFYWTWPAKLLYIILAAAIIYIYYRRLMMRNEERHREELRAMSEKKDLEVRDARLRFFTTISHEIRTPVSLIIGPLENLMEEWGRISSQVKNADAVTSTLDVINRNAHRLLDLVNQILDFNKVQNEGHKLVFKPVCISKLMKAVAVRFEPTLKLRGVSFSVTYPQDDFCAIVDEEGVTKILSNLMTNAMKYTRSSVSLSCRVADADTFVLEVADDGQGISTQDQAKIFAPFYQANDNKPGTGIGLSIVQTLVAAHHGKVEVVSQLDRGAHFVVTLPTRQTDAAVDEEVKEPIVGEPSEVEQPDVESVAPAVSESSARQSILIVDDDQDLRQFLESSFANQYSVRSASNGNEALARLAESPADLIISDWMMPEMDGDEFCRRVRKDINICHTPFIMLTAKTDDDSKAGSMDCGADLFIEKPFSMKYLSASVRNLIEMRRMLQERFSISPTATVDEIATSPLDDEFLKKLNKLIEDNMDNPDLGVQFLAERMGVSRSSLFQKIKSLAGVTPNEMVTLVRLKAAARMLREKRYRVNEISYRVGYNSPSYFSKSFLKQFGMKPLEYAEAKG